MITFFTSQTWSTEAGDTLLSLHPTGYRVHRSYAIGQDQLEQLRDAIIAALGYAEAGIASPTLHEGVRPDGLPW